MFFLRSWLKTPAHLRPSVEPNENMDDRDAEQHEPPSFAHIYAQFNDCIDIVHRSFPRIETQILYFGHLVGSEELKRDVITPLLHTELTEIESLLLHSQFIETTDSKKCVKGILNGSVAVFYRYRTFLVDVFGPASRSVNKSETETVITGPHDAFIENIGTNLSLVRRRIKSSHLKILKLGVGEITKSDVYVLYIQDIADMKLVHTVVQRINDIEIDAVFEGNMLVQLIDEHPNSVFPQFMTSERPDVITSKLVAGKIVIFTDCSPSAICTPTDFFEFFSSPDDLYQRWALGTGLRILRFIAFIITVVFTAFYVSITTFHYEMIPQTLLLNMAESRSRVPFPPLVEAILMETMIELLREAGARLPTKIGQTIGIVGGIVIGQAAVQAGFTSNILIIAVASSAIASFVIPSYTMSASIRLLRFALIILAGIWGNLGLMLGIAAIIIHLASLSNLGTSYLTPIAPMNLSDWKDTFIRAPIWSMKTRPSVSRAKNMSKNKMKR
jgi:spore germination protein